MNHPEFQNPIVNAKAKHELSAGDWSILRKQHLRTLQEIQYGFIPENKYLSKNLFLQRSRYPHLVNAVQELFQVKLLELGNFSFEVEVLYQDETKKNPVIICGDLNWRFMSDDIINFLLEEGFALIFFNRLQFAGDVKLAPEQKNDSGIYPHFPGIDFGAIAAWAWGYQRVIDFIYSEDRVNPFLDLNQIIISGHSRGGKAVLLAGALDERVAVTGVSQSGCGGAGSYTYKTERTENLKNVVEKFPHWFVPDFSKYADREETLPFDQHFLKACVAPRGLLTTETMDDEWANPKGTWLTYLEAKKIYRALGQENRCEIWYRKGPHAQARIDWEILVNFAKSYFKSEKVNFPHDDNPFIQSFPTAGSETRFGPQT